jgi:DNA-binding transcriptional ArsR family regulator
MRAAISCVRQTTLSHLQNVLCCSRSHAGWVKRGLEMYRETCSWRERLERDSSMNRIARACESKSGVSAESFGRWLISTQRSGALRSFRSVDAMSSVLARLVEEEHGDVLAFLTDGESWSSSALALALGASQRTVQRALDSLAAAGKVQSFGRARARRWITPPVPGFTTILLLPTRLPVD